MQEIDMRKAKLGADHPNTLSSVNNLAFMFKGLGIDCCRPRDKVLGPYHPYTVLLQVALTV
ncbi:hypothetical protein K491DRAFT_615048 [Lophiostoma macrostomum CBS 122681]|uniref:Kinesin light chain n=1 Tax=Lophiostoma macrostomum CBS 122681 TaxID=1314788 RepID=A0A6A6SIE9_9PLEO|nr:hypothetical protein K491DRAFT_615048 [Lophiostoma macrostomum CBS 122681]